MKSFVGFRAGVSNDLSPGITTNDFISLEQIDLISIYKIIC
ncbi:MAG: hypothetical protein Edafosvirus37_12 [Edafosvirus sp.]|uniref:Uncharacterized protein n=1 Tax=Edafosvirus sp. TaxID=2487765 RepID=A0A3G4ZVA8_9VIRU|nr:MAG: hypothetical protein Edafosvirus37_12 [Edafosvirus sp.]